MPRDGTATRERILDATERLVLRQGFAATTVDGVAAEAGVAKGAFFHHFPSKAELARALVERYARADAAHLEQVFGQATRLARDPLQRLLVFAGLLAEGAAAISGESPGCLYASFCYERQLVDASTLRLIEEAMQRWRARLVPLLREVADRHPPRLPVDLESLADQVMTVFEGAFVVSRATGEAAVVSRQLAHLRNYLELLFATDGRPGDRPAGPRRGGAPEPPRAGTE